MSEAHRAKRLTLSPTAAKDYTSWLADLKQRICSAQQRAVLSANRELVLLYWQIGREIMGRQQLQGWGAKVIERLAKDLSAAFPDMKGFSRSNLMYMRAFHEAWPDETIVQQLVGQLPWGQNLLLLTKLLMEFGEGFAFAGRQVHVEVDGQDFYIDLLFYNYRLHRFLVVELKAGDFKPEHAGQLNFYITLVDERIKSAEDKPTLGLLLCKQQHRVVAEYALRGMTQPIGVAEYKLQLPDDIARYLPTVEQIEAELAEDDDA